MANLHISVSAEPVAHLGPLVLTNSMLTSIIVTAGLVIFAVYAHKRITPTNKPKGIQALLESITEALYGLVAGIAGERKARQIFPYIATFFIFILLGNWFGLLPGVGTITVPEVESVVAEEVTDTTETIEFENEPGTESSETVDIHETPVPELKVEEKAIAFVPLFRGPTADLSITLALALVSVGLTQYIGLKNLGLGYISKFINFKSPIHFFIGILELIAECAKILSFAFRLFGNIFAGEVLLAVMAFLVPIFAPLPFIGLEVFVGLVQALVFSMLTLVFMNLATISHNEHE